MRALRLLMFALQSSAVVALCACGRAEAPATRETIVLEGTPYERGFQHGEKLKSKVRSFYARLLGNAILPNLNREQPDLAEVFAEYRKDRYANGRFSYELLLDNARSLERSIPLAYRDEMRGIADGAGVPYEQVLITNTFLDALLSIRAVAAVAHFSGAPRLERVQWLGGIDSDGVDNDGNGEIDEADEADAPYAPSPVTTRVEVPRDTALRLTLVDEDGVDPATVRLTLAGHVYAAGDPAMTMQPLVEDPTRLEVSLTPPEPLPVGPVVLRVQAGDRAIQQNPPPAHAHFMRDERLTFTTAGTGLALGDVPNQSDAATAERAPAFAFTSGVLLAHQFALLDANTAHEHTVLFVHHPSGGRAFAVVGWAGIVWGMSGMNEDGLAGACNPADTLDNSVVNGLLGQIADLSSAKLLASGEPIGIFLRSVLEKDTAAEAAVERAHDARHTFGWTCLFADASGARRAFEVDSNFDKDGGVFELPDPDVIGSHFQRNVDDIPAFTIQGQRIQPERGWSSFFFRSVSAVATVREALGAQPAPLDPEGAIVLLRRRELVDPSDSMNAVVFEPAQRRMRVAMGQVPAPDADFEVFSFGGEAR